MEHIDALMLARIQFAFTITFHIVFPAFTIGIASYLAVLEGMWLRTNNIGYLKLYRYWSKIFAVSFGMGVVSGLVMSFQFGTNWSEFSYITGPVLGPLIGYEVITAFFLESGFLAIMLFGWNRVGRGLHWFATCAVAFGTFLSSFWILAANSWMNTPVGHSIVNGQFVPHSWLEIIFSPSMPYRFVHMVIGAFLTTAFVVGGVSAIHLLRNNANQTARVSFSMAMWMALVVAPVQLIVGDLHGLNTLEHQPAKVAAMEGYFTTRTEQPLYLFGMPDMQQGKVRGAIALPGFGSLVLGHSADARIVGLDAVPREQWPHVPTVFWSFRIMVGLGLLMILVGLMGAALRMRGQLYDQSWFLRFVLLMAPSGFLAVIAGWFVTEVGRQPWTVYGLLSVSDSVTPSVTSGVVGLSLALFVIGYGIVFGMGCYYLLHLMGKDPDAQSLRDAKIPSMHTQTLPMTDRSTDATDGVSL